MDFLFPLLKNSKSGVDDRVTGYEFAWRRGALLEFPMRTAKHGKSRVSSAVSVCDN